MDKQDLKTAAKDAGKLWLAKKGFEWTGSLIKVGIVAGVGYLAYKFFRDNQDQIEEKFSSMLE